MKVHIFGMGKMGKIHAKYLVAQNVPYEYTDKDDYRVFEGITHAIICSPYKSHWINYCHALRNYGPIPMLIEKPVFVVRNQIPEIKNVFAGMCERYNFDVFNLKSSLNFPVKSLKYVNNYLESDNPNLDIGIHGIDLAHFFEAEQYDQELIRSTKKERYVEIDTGYKKVKIDLRKSPHNILYEQHAFFNAEKCDATKAHEDLL